MFFILHAELLRYVYNRWKKTMDPNDDKLTDFKELIHEAIVLLDNILYRQPNESCAQLHSILSTEVVRVSF